MMFNEASGGADAGQENQHRADAKKRKEKTKSKRGDREKKQIELQQ